METKRTKVAKRSATKRAKPHPHNGFGTKMNAASSQIPKPLQQYAKKAAMMLHEKAHAGHMAHGKHGVSTRETEFKGHRIVIKTHYEVRVDRKKIGMPFSADNDGQVTCHAVPNYSAASAIDVAKQIIAAYPHYFLKKKRARRT